MGTQSAADIISAKMAELKQKQGSITEGVQVFRPNAQPIDIATIIIKPSTKTWEELELVLRKVVNLSGMWKTVRERYDAGKGAELETAAEIALAKYKQTPYQYFAAMVDKKHGNWEEQTLKTVEETWKVRQDALRVMETLKLDGKITNYVLSLVWKFRSSITRFLALATEKGYNIKNPAGYFFGIIKNIKAAT
jgi:K+ transporter